MCQIACVDVNLLMDIVKLEIFSLSPLFAAFIDIVHSSNGTTKAITEYGSMQDSKSKRIKSSKREGKKNMSVVPSHFIQTDVSNIKGGSLIFSNLMFCIPQSLTSGLQFVHIKFFFLCDVSYKLFCSKLMMLHKMIVLWVQ